MFAIFECLENAEKKTLCFASVEDAKRFKNLVNTYMEESGAGNGYGAYWVLFETEIEEVPEIMENFCTELDDNLITKMIQDVIRARTAGNPQGIIFNLPELPKPQRPTRGDMFRTLFSRGANRKIEGRVINDNGDMLDVINCWDDDDNGKPKKDAKIITIPAAWTMKINDWKAELRKKK